MRHYGRFPGERGTHFLSGNAELEVVHTDFTDNNRAQYRFYGGERSGEEFDATAEHFEPLPKSARCPTCGEPVYSIFDHVDQHGEESSMPKIRQYVAVTFRPGDAKTYTYHNDRDPVAVGDKVVITGKGGPKTVTVVSVGDEKPPYDTKPIVGKERPVELGEALGNTTLRALEAMPGDQ